MASSSPFSGINSQTIPGVSVTSNSGTGSSLGGSSAQSIQDQFLKLFVAQLNAQDPLNPMDNSQMTTQMAQISQVSGIQQLNQTMTSLIGAQAASQSLMAAGMIGKQVVVPGNTLDFPATGETSKGGVLLNGPAKSVQVDIKDAKGNVVDSVTLTNPTQGINTFTWDGTDSNGNPLPKGDYTFAATVTQASSGGTTTAATYHNKSVTAVAWDKGVPELIMPDGTRVSLGDVALMS